MSLTLPPADPGGRSPLPVDSLGMWQWAASLPEQVEEAVRTAAEVTVPEMDAISNVVAIGMGGSGIAGDVLAAVTSGSMPVPAIVVKSYELPASVGPDSLVFAVSCSGETEETVAAADAAWKVGATVVVVAGGGRLTTMAEEAGAVVIPVPGDIPQPRAALGALCVPPLVVLGRLGLIPDQRTSLAAAAKQLGRRRDQLVQPGSLAEAVARRIGRTFPLIHGSPGLTAVAAQRWKTQVNENAKSPAFWSVHPELGHNEVAGWGQSGDVTRQVLTLITLRHPGEPAQINRRFEFVTELLREVVADVIEVHAQGSGDLARFFDLALVGDFVSLHLAGREGIDPGPVPVLAELKEDLGHGADRRTP